MEYENLMQEPRIQKVVVNMGVGESGQPLVNAEDLMERITGRKPVRTYAKKKIPNWEVKGGEPIGCKVTMRDQKAKEFLENALEAAENEIQEKNFDEEGNFSFGIHEYIDFPNMKYDPDIGIFGMDVTVVLERPGFRVKKRRLQSNKIPEDHRITKEEAIEFIKEKFNVEVKEG